MSISPRRTTSRGPRGPRFVLSILAGTVVGMGIAAAGAGVIRVEPAATDSTHTLAGALAEAAPGDTLLLAPGLYRGIYDLPRGVSVVGAAGPDSTILDADGGRYVLSGRGLDSTTVIAGLTLQNGKRDHPNSGGGGIYLYRSSPVIVNNVFRNHLGYFGAGVYTNYGCNPVIAFNRFHDNEAHLGGALAAYQDCAPLVYENFVYSNRAVSGGGMLCMNSAPVLVHNTWVANRAEPGGGGALYGDSSPALVVGNVFAYNEDPKRDGGAVFALDDDRPAVLRDNILWENLGGAEGGACAPFVGVEGNCSEDPQFMDRQRFLLERQPAAASCQPTAGARRWSGPVVPVVPDSILGLWREWRRSGAR